MLSSKIKGATTQLIDNISRKLYRKLLIALIFVVTSLLCCLYFLASKWPPHLTFLNDTDYYYGVVEEGEIVAHNFVIKNEGLSPLRLKNIKTGCVCTSASAEKLTLGRGETTKIKITYKARPVRNQETLQIILVTNDPHRPMAKLFLRCDVLLKVFWYPKSVSIYTKEGTKNVKKEIRFLTETNEDIELTEIITSSNRIKAYKVRDNDGIKFVVKLNPGCPQGNWEDKISMRALTEQYEKKINIPVHLMVKEQ